MKLHWFNDHTSLNIEYIECLVTNVTFMFLIHDKECSSNNCQSKKISKMYKIYTSNIAKYEITLV